jgi:hypothetical protein
MKPYLQNLSAILVIVLITLLSSHLIAQTIIINYNFNSDTTFNPFGSLKKIYSLKINGTVKLLYQAWISIVNRAYSNNNNLTFDSIQVNNLHAMLAIDTLNLFLPTVLARNVLVNEGILDYSEPLIFDSELKSANIRKVYHKILIPNTTNGYLKVYPNPANDYLIVEYQLPENCSQSILKLTSVDGKLIKQFILNSARKEIIVPTDGFPTQLIISILSGDELIGNKKVIISN